MPVEEAEAELIDIVCHALENERRMTPEEQRYFDRLFDETVKRMENE